MDVPNGARGSWTGNVLPKLTGVCRCLRLSILYAYEGGLRIGGYSISELSNRMKPSSSGDFDVRINDQLQILCIA